MDLDSIEGLNEVRPAVYRAALKLRSLQKLCQMHTVTLRELRPVLHLLSQTADPRTQLSEPEVRQGLERLFQSVPDELPEQVIPEAIDQTTRLLFKLYDREKTGSVLLHSVEAALAALSGDTLPAKHRALYRLGENLSGHLGRESSTVTRSGLRVLLHDLSQVPAVVQESHVFGHVETAVRSCFSGVMTAGVCEEVFVRWLQSEPRLLLWFSTLYRISASEDVVHAVRCRVCKAFPITGLRYRCLKCVNLHLCQTCFLTERRSKKHKPSHPVLEYCSQPTWKESLASLASNARHALLPRRYTRREAERRRELTRGDSSGDTANTSRSESPLQHLQPPTLSQQSCDFSGKQTQPSLPPPPVPASPSLPSAVVSPEVQVESKALQTDEDLQPQRKASLLQKDLHVTQKVMKDLQRDKWLLEKEFQVWRAAAQSEHDSLEDRCAELEATMEALSRHNHSLEQELQCVRHALSLRRVNTGDDAPHHPFIRPTSPDCGERIAGPLGSRSESPTSQPLSSEEGEDQSPEEEDEVTEKNQEVKEVESWKFTQKEEDDDDNSEVSRRSNSTGCDDTRPLDVTSELEQHADTTEESLQREEDSEGGEASDCVEEMLRSYEEETLSQVEYLGGPLDEGEGEEEQLCELVLKLRTTLSLPTNPAGSPQRNVLLKAAQGVGDCVSYLVTMANVSSAHPPVPHTLMCQ